MFAGHDQAVANSLRDHGVVSRELLDALLSDCAAASEPLADALLARGLIRRADLLRTVAAALGVRWIDPVPRAIPAAVLGTLPAALARRFGVVPLHAERGHLQLLTGDPFDGRLAPEIGFALGLEIDVALGDPPAVAQLVERHYGTAAPTPFAELEAQSGPAEVEATDARLARQAGELPVVRFVNRILRQAVRDHASDVHFEPFREDFRVRSRVDGTLRDEAAPPARFARPVISRLKALAGLNIAERRVPQDGRLRFPIGGRSVDLRVSTLPTRAGESVVLRVLDQAAAPLNLGELGLAPAVERGIRDAIARPNGLLLVTGPTGSGKTTTLYGCLRILNQSQRKIVTAEDPVEYEIDGIVQLPIDPAIGLTFAAALRAFLRHDPDVLMVGEIRDQETGRTAVQAALTGHLVLSTLHTNDAVGAVVRLVDMGIEPFLLVATLEGVLAQRLVRRLCPRCREPASVPAEAADSGFDLGACWRGRGCEFCRQTGYQGRLGLYEWMRLDSTLRDLITARAPEAALREAAIAGGMEPLRAAGLRAVRAGLTSVEEVRIYV